MTMPSAGRTPKTGAVRNNELSAETVMPMMCTCSQNIFLQRLAGCLLFRRAQWRCRCKADMCFPKPYYCNGSDATLCAAGRPAALQRLLPVMSASRVHGLGHAAVIHAPVSSRPSGRFQVLLTMLASRYVHDACTSADLVQFGVNLLAA